MPYFRVHVSTLPADRTERHIPAFPFSSVWDVGVSYHQIANPLPNFSLFEKRIHDTADLSTGGDPGFPRSQKLTSGEDLFNFKPVKVSVGWSAITVVSG